MKRFWLPMAALLGGCGVQARVDDIMALTPDAANGEALFADECSSCHGAVGEGDSGPAIAGTAQDEVILEMFEGPDEMPEFTDMDDQDIADISDYVAGL